MRRLVGELPGATGPRFGGGTRPGDRVADLECVRRDGSLDSPAKILVFYLTEPGGAGIRRAGRTSVTADYLGANDHNDKIISSPFAVGSISGYYLSARLLRRWDGRQHAFMAGLALIIVALGTATALVHLLPKPTASPHQKAQCRHRASRESRNATEKGSSMTKQSKKDAKDRKKMRVNVSWIGSLR